MSELPLPLLFALLEAFTEGFGETQGEVGMLAWFLGGVEVADDLGIALQGSFFFRSTGSRSSR